MHFLQIITQDYIIYCNTLAWNSTQFWTWLNLSSSRTSGESSTNAVVRNDRSTDLYSGVHLDLKSFFENSAVCKVWLSLRAII